MLWGWLTSGLAADAVRAYTVEELREHLAEYYPESRRTVIYKDLSQLERENPKSLQVIKKPVLGKAGKPRVIVYVHGSACPNPTNRAQQLFDSIVQAADELRKLGAG